MKSKIKVLVVASDYLYPANHGGRVDVCERVKFLVESGFDVDIVSTVKKHEVHHVDENGLIESTGVSNVIISERNGLKSFFSRYSYQEASRKSLRTISLPREHYDFVFLEGDYVSQVINNPNLKYTRLFYRVHNNEFRYFLGLAKSTSNFLKKIFYFSEAFRIKSCFKRLATVADSVLFISSDELQYKKSKYPLMNDKFVFVPPHVELNDLDFRDDCLYKEEQNTDEHILLFVGSLFMDNNFEAVEWFSNEVMPKVSASLDGVRFIVAGNSRGRNTSRIAAEVVDSPTDDELLKIYGRSDLFINPMRNGAGVKIKTINAIKVGMPIVSTKIGCEGTGLLDGSHLLIRDDPEEFADAVIQLLLNRAQAIELAECALEYVSNTFSFSNFVNNHMSSKL